MGEPTHLGTFLRECRNGLKYTSRQVAQLSNRRDDLPSISNSYLISVENGKHIPRLDKVIALADLLNVPITHLVDRCREDLGGRAKRPPEGDFAALVEAGRECAEMNDHGKALALFRQAQQVAQASSNGHSVSAADRAELHYQMANCYRRLKINRVAKEELEGLLKDRDLDRRLRARAAFALAEIYREEGSTFLGGILAREALTMSREIGDEVLEGKLLSALGNLSAEDGRLDEALTMYRDAGQKLARHGHQRAATLARVSQGLVLIEKRDFFRAIELLRATLNECREDDSYNRGWLHIGLAKAYYGAENLKSARVHARNAKEFAERLETPDLMFLACFYLWSVARHEGAADQASLWFEKLKYHRNKLEVKLQEVEHFDRLRKAVPSEKEVQR